MIHTSNMNDKDSQSTELTLSKSAKYLGVSKGFLSGVCARHEITYRKVGNRIKISILDLDLYRAEITVKRVSP